MSHAQVVFVHSIFGALVFVIALLQLILKRGGKLHRMLGRTYFFSWLGLLLTGVYIGGLLFIILGIFGFYYVLTGVRLTPYFQTH